MGDDSGVMELSEKRFKHGWMGNGNNAAVSDSERILPDDRLLFLLHTDQSELGMQRQRLRIRCVGAIYHHDRDKSCVSPLMSMILVLEWDLPRITHLSIIAYPFRFLKITTSEGIGSYSKFSGGHCQENVGRWTLHGTALMNTGESGCEDR